MHVPEENLVKYRQLMGMSRQFKSLGDTIGQNDMQDSTICWRLAAKYQAKAQELRVPGKGTLDKGWVEPMSPNVRANVLASCHNCGGGVGEFKASASNGTETRYFCHNDNRSCYNERRGTYFED